MIYEKMHVNYMTLGTVVTPVLRGPLIKVNVKKAKPGIGARKSFEQLGSCNLPMANNAVPQDVSVTRTEYAGGIIISDA